MTGHSWDIWTKICNQESDNHFGCGFEIWNRRNSNKLDFATQKISGKPWYDTILFPLKLWWVKNNFQFFYQNYEFFTNFEFIFFNRIYIFDHNLDFWQELRFYDSQFFTRISFFDQNFNFDQNLNIWRELQFLARISILTRI